jgi:hypothetical protein
VSVSPDEGMMLLQQQMAATAAARGAGAPDTAPAAGGEAVAGGELGIMVRLAAALESNTAELQRQRSAAEMTWALVHPIEIPPQQSDAAGTLQDPDRWGPSQGWAWRIFGWTVVLGAGATSFSIWLDSPNDPTNLLFTSSVSGRWEPSHFYLMPQRQMVFTSVGGGLTVCKGQAAEIAINYLPGYLGLKA